MANEVGAKGEMSHVGLIAREQETAMSGFERGNVVFDHAAQPDDLDGMGTKNFLPMIAHRDVKKDTGQKYNDQNSGRGAGEEFELKVTVAEKPGEPAAKRAGSGLLEGSVGLGLSRLAHYNFKKAGLLPIKFPSIQPPDSVD
jgi:hypothetical protein